MTGRDEQLESKKKQAEKQAQEAAQAKKKAEQEKFAKARADNCERAKRAKATLDSGIRRKVVTADKGRALKALLLVERSREAERGGSESDAMVLAREAYHQPRVLLVGQPTRGVDIGAIEFIHKRIVETRDAGKAVLLVSVELDEIRSLSDRILVMFAGKVVGEKTPDTGEQTLGLMMAGIAA